MLVKSIALVLLTCIGFTGSAQTETKETFLGFGWIVGVSVDIVFVPADRIDKLPTVEDYFKQVNKTGFRVNDENNAFEALKHCKRLPIEWREDGRDTIEITPVIAFYTVEESEKHY